MKNRHYLFTGGILFTAIYILLLLYLLGPFDEFLAFIRSSPYNERGDFFAGIFGPIAFLWLIVGYFMQSSELRLQRGEIAKQYDARLYELELEKRKNDPEFQVELDKNDILIQNISDVWAKKIHVYYISHERAERTIIGIVSTLPPGGEFNCKFESWMPIPIQGQNKSEILIMYDSKLETMRCQVWEFLYTSKEQEQLIAWQLNSANHLPTYFDQYRQKP